MLGIWSVNAQLLPSNSVVQTATFGTNTYMVIDQPFDRPRAEKLATAYGGVLAIPTTQEENDFLVTLAAGNSFWLGIHRESAGKDALTFLSDYDNKPIEWTNWNRLEGFFEPNFDAGDEWYAMCYGTITPWWVEQKTKFVGLWNDQSGHWPLTVIVQIPIQPAVGLNSFVQGTKSARQLTISWSQPVAVIEHSYDLKSWSVFTNKTAGALNIQPNKAQEFFRIRPQ